MGLQQVEEIPVEKSVPNGPEEIQFPAPYYTYIVLGSIACVFAVQYLTSSDPLFLSMDRYSSIRAGFDKQAFADGQYWRILTGATIHSGVLHAGMNAYALYSFGWLVEALSNRVHFAIVFLLSALGGGFLSLVFLPEGVSVGASGGIVGLLSYLAVYTFKRRKFVSREFRRSLLVNIGFIILFGLVLFNHIDNFGHIGGLVTGAVYAVIQIPSDEYTDPREARLIIKITGVAALLIYVLTCAFTIFLLLTAPPI